MDSLNKKDKKTAEKGLKTDFVISSIGLDDESMILFNEKEKRFVSFAEVLGFERVVFCYNAGDFVNFAGSFDLKKIKELIKRKKEYFLELENEFKVILDIGIIFNIAYNKKIEFILGLKQENTLLFDCSEGFDRELLEKIKPNLIFNLEYSNEKDFIHQRNAGINEAIVGFMEKNSIGYGISLSEIRKMNKEQKNINLILGRIYQNAKLIQDFNVDFNIFSLAKEPKEMQSLESMKSFVKLIGFDTSYVKNSILTTK